MNAVLLIAPEYPQLNALRRGLAGSLALLYTDRLDQGKNLLDDPRVSILVLDCAGDAASAYALLRWVEARRPEVECIALVEPQHFCPIYDTRRRNLYRLLKPAGAADLCEHILRTAHKAERMSSGDWARDPVLLRRQDRQLWLHLLSGMLPPSEEALLSAAPPAAFQYRQRQRVLPVLFCLRRWQNADPQGRDDRRYAVQALATRTLLQNVPGCFFPWKPDTLLVLLYGPDFPAEDRLRTLCTGVTLAASEHFGCDVACYSGTPCLAHQLPEQADLLLRGDLDNVTNARAMLTLEQVTRQKHTLSLPVLRDWMPYFIDGREEEFCRCIEDYFSQASAANTMDRAFLARFQQDFIQELGFALKNAGVPLHELFSGTDELLRMEKAIRYVPDMLAWVRACAHRAIALTRPDQAGKTIAQQVCDYLNHRLVYSYSRAELSRALRLSEGHIAREFRREMSMSISEYLSRERIKLACLTIRQTGLSLTQVAEQCGFHDYPYFYKTFKKYTGLSPTEYQEKKPDLEM